ncbi:MAG: hypothetical protein H0V22_08100 [Solirubrobacterales bacterium]|nr:hypothetical protein [Solirubrobacterales bacterium]
MSTRIGLVALGDSITVGEGNMVCGIPCRSWALWLAEALDLPFTSRAFNGATTADVRAAQLPRVRADYDVGCLYAGVTTPGGWTSTRRRSRATYARSPPVSPRTARGS